MNIIAKFESMLEKSSVKRLLISLILGIAVSGYVSEYCYAVQNDLSSNIIRLHIIANSDDAFDQSLKLAVRDSVTDYLCESLADAKTFSSVKQTVNNNLKKLTEVSKETLARYNCRQNVTAVTGVFDFPTKFYGDTRLPGGKYYALRIIIGDGKGKNWWCVLYPKLCFEQFDTNELKSAVGNEAYSVITDDGAEYRFKFKLLELFGK